MFIFFKNSSLLSPMTGKNIPLSEVKDEVFAKEMVGPGCAIIPSEGEVVSPISGNVSLIAATKHCICIKGDDGLEIMLHFGIDSFKAKEKGFDYFVNVGDSVKKGDLLCHLNITYFAEHKIDITTPIIILNHKRFCIKEVLHNNSDIDKGDVLLIYKKI